MNTHPLPISETVKFGCRRIAVVLLLAVSMTIAPLVPTTVHAQGIETIHVVAPGETLSAIAARYNVSIRTLMTYNNIRNADIIQVGQTIRIPPTVQPISTPTPAESGNVATPNAEKSVDPNVTPESAPSVTGRPTLRPTVGAPVPAPVTGYTAQGEPVYTVRRGDTLSGIGVRFGVTVAAIMQRNGLLNQVITVSQRLIIPLPEAAPAPVYSPQVTGPADANPTPRPQAAPTADPGSGSGIYLLPTVEATPTPDIGAKLR